MPSDVSDLRDVVDAINKLCDTMKSSYRDADIVEEEQILEREVAEDVEAGYEPGSYEHDLYLDPAIVSIVYDEQPMIVPISVAFDSKPVVEPVIYDSQLATTKSYSYEPRTTTVPVTYQQPNDMSDSQSTVTLIGSESELTTASVFESEVSEVGVVEATPCEPTSEMYYTASSEVSLLSDMDLHERVQSEDSDKDRDGRNSVMAGHVAAMRERFESMTRTNTPCPDLIRSSSPSFEVFRNASTSPDVEKS